MTEFKRFAVYYAPLAGAFSDFANAWLGWDAARGCAVPHPEVGDLPMPVDEITRTPRRYGFHGTIKPPFHLREGTNRAGLDAELATLAARLAPVRCDGLALHSMGGFLALTPRGDTRALADLAATIVRDLDHFRAPPSAAETERRRKAGLTARQNASLAQWGYPYVMDDFRFHLTLTGKLPDSAAPQIEAALDRALAPLLPAPFDLRDLCLFGEDENGRFHLLDRYTLSS